MHFSTSVHTWCKTFLWYFHHFPAGKCISWRSMFWIFPPDLQRSPKILQIYISYIWHFATLVGAELHQFLATLVLHKFADFPLLNVGLTVLQISRFNWKSRHNFDNVTLILTILPPTIYQSHFCWSYLSQICHSWSIFDCSNTCNIWAKIQNSWSSVLVQHPGF